MTFLLLGFLVVDCFCPQNKITIETQDSKDSICIVFCCFVCFFVMFNALHPYLVLF